MTDLIMIFSKMFTFQNIVDFLIKSVKFLLIMALVIPLLYGMARLMRLGRKD